MALGFCRSSGPLSRDELSRDRWVLAIIEAMLRGVENYQELRTELGIARNILADRLKMMTDRGLIERVKIMDDMRVVTYRLTNIGLDMKPIIAAHAAWSAKYGAVDQRRDHQN
ncbi:hypothetical protein BH10PSE12_BH10PSE12_17610 [soil metagenome]